jgi:hypothetical protein
MDAIIAVKEVDNLLKSPPTMGKRPTFFSLRELRKHIITVLKQLPHPGYPIHGWSGMATQPALFALLDPTPFVVPIDPGLYPTYAQYALAPAMKMADNIFKANKNMYTTYNNIGRAVLAMLTKAVPEQFRTSNNSTMTGWNQTMSINDILDQLEIAFGRPGAAELLINQAAWSAPHSNQDEPESLFLRLEQCQIVAILANNAYTDKQMITNAVLLLRQSNIFPTKDFDDWDDVAEATKTWPIMRAFFHKKYTKRMTSISMNAKSGQHGYAGANPYGIFHTAHDDNDSTTTEGTTLTVAAPTVTLPGSTLGMGTTVSPEVSSAIAQLAANQAEMMRQMAALTIAPPPPIQQITIPTQQFANGPGRRGGGGYNNSSGCGGNTYTGGTGGRGGGTPNNWGYNGGYTAGYNPQTGRGRTGRGRTYRNRRGRGSFAEAAGGIVPLGTPQGGPNPVKRFNNWNYCYSCGFDVEDGHTSMTCPQTWRRAGHQITCTRENYNQFLAAGHTPSVKAMHKNQLPPQGGF